MKKYTHSICRWSTYILTDGSMYYHKSNLRKNILFTETDTSNHINWSFKKKDLSKRTTYEL